MKAYAVKHGRKINEIVIECLSHEVLHLSSYLEKSQGNDFMSCAFSNEGVVSPLYARHLQRFEREVPWLKGLIDFPLPKRSISGRKRKGQ